MVLVGDLRIWELDNAKAHTNTLTDGSNADLVTGREHEFSDTSDILVDCGMFRLSFPVAGTVDSTFTVWVRDPAEHSGNVGDEGFVKTGYFDAMVAPDTDSEIVRDIQILENTPNLVSLKVLYESNNFYLLTVRSGHPVVEVVTGRGMRDSAHQKHHVGFELHDDSRFTLLGDGTVVKDHTNHSSGKTTTSTPDTFITHTYDGNHWVAGWSTEYKPSQIEDNIDLAVEVNDARTSEKRRQWLFLCPTFQGDLVDDSGNADVTTQQFSFQHDSATASGEQYTITLGTSGYWKLAAARRDAASNGISIDVGGTTVLNSGATTQNEFVTSDSFEANGDPLTIDVTVSTPDASADTVIVAIPMNPSNNTGDMGVFTFPGYVSKVPLGRQVRDHDLVEVSRF